MATVPCLGTFPGVALACVEVGVVAEDVRIVAVLVAMGRGLVGVPADAVADVRCGRIDQTWRGVGVAEMCCAAVAPWFAFFVGYCGVGDVRLAWCVPC